MSKLAEIKEYTEMCKTNNLAVSEHLEYLLSLIEEKDKALKRIIEHFNSDSTDTLIVLKMLSESQNALKSTKEE